MKRFYKFLMPLVAIVALALPMSLSAQTTCQIKIVGEDAYGDGWNGGSLAVVQGGTTVATFSAPNADDGGMEVGAYDSTIVTVNNAPVSFVWSEGEYDEEVTIWIYHSSGALLFSVTEPAAGTIFTLSAPCSGCFAPSALTLSDVGSDEATITWSGAADGYGYLWGTTADMADGFGTSDYTTDNYVELSGLSSGTGYTFMVWSDCGTEVSDTVTLTFATTGEAVSAFPYLTGFEAGEDTAWSYVNDATNKWFVGTGASHTGSTGLYISNDNGTTNAYSTSSTQFSYAYRVLSFADAGQYAVIFDWKAYGEGNYDYLRAWIAPASAAASLQAGHSPDGGTSSYSYTTSTPAGWIDLGGKMNLQTSWQTTTATPTLAAGNYILVFMWANDGSSGTTPPAAIDNVSIIQNTCPQVMNLAATYVGQDTVILEWQAGGEENEWTVSDGINEYTTTDTTYTFDGLNANTTYNFTVRAVCGSDDTSLVTAISVRTACGDIVLPFVETFPGAEGSAPACWTTIASGSYPYITTSYGNSLKFGGTAAAISPAINAALNTLLVSFDIQREGSSSGSMTFGYTTDPTIADSIHILNTITPSTTSQYFHYEYDLGTNADAVAAADYIDGPVYLVWRQNGSTAWYYWLDNVNIEVANPCAKPTNFVATAVVNPDSIAVTWTEAGEATNWQIFIGTSNTTPNENATPIDVYSNDYVFSGLYSGTTYYAWVRSDCGDSYSNWQGPLQIIPGSINMPATGSMTVTGCGLTIYDDGGATGDYSNNCNGSLTVYPSTDSLIRFYGSYYTESNNLDYLKIYEGVGTSGNLLFDQQATSSSQGNIDTITCMSGPITITFHSDGSVVKSGFEIHTFCVPAPDCGAVTDINVTAGPHSALVSWTPGYIGEYTGATVEYKETTATSWTTLTTSDTYIGITGLDTLTDYDVRVQANCEAGNATWENAQFTTGSYDCLVMDSTSLVEDTIGDGTTTNSYFPTYSTYNYSVTQQIYRASDFDSASLGGVITKIGFQLADMPVTRDWYIYVSTTTANDVNSAFIPISANDLVWHGSTASLTANAWNEIELPHGIALNGSNVLVTFQDMTGSWSSGNYGVVTSTSYSGISRYIYQDAAAYDPTGTISGGTASSNRLNMYFKGGTCLQQQTCPAPILWAEGTDVDEITLNWVAGNTETSWNVYYRAANDSVFTLAGTATTDSYVLNNLQPSSHYFFKVASVCNSTEGGVAEADCYTACSLVPVPFSEDFENEPYGIFERPCWFTGSTELGTSYPYPSVVSLQGSENKLPLIYNGGYLVLPEFDAQLNTLQIRFTFIQGGDNVRLILGLLDQLESPISTITPLDTLIRSNMDSVNSEVVVTYPFDFLDDSVRGHIVFWDAFNDNYSFIDDIIVEAIPSCTSIDSVTVSNITSTDADVSWLVGGNLTTSYLVEYGVHGFTVGSGIHLPATTNNITLTGLNPGISYDVYVYAICSAAGDTSHASNVARFTTECATVTLPYSEAFDHVLEPGSTAKQLPNCWTYTMLDAGYSSSSYYPTAYYTSTTGYTSSGSYCLWLYGKALTVLPEMPTTVDSLMISFHEYNTSPSSYKLIIGAVDSITPGFEASFVGIDTIQYTGAYEYNHFFFLSDYQGTGRYIAFKNIYNNDQYGYSYHYIDDIVVDYVPSCIYPMNFRTTTVTTTTADIAWGTSNATDYEYEYGIHGFTRGTGITGTCTGRAASLTNLTLGTSYDIYVRGICGAGDTSAWSSVYTFRTLNADPTTAPYSCDFTDTTLTNCGFEVVNSANNAWYVGNAVSNGTPNALYISNNGGTSNSYTNSSVQVSYAYRDITLAGGEYSYSFDWRANGESSYDYLRAWLAPIGFEFTAGQLPDGSTSTYSYNSSSPAGWISLDGGTKMNVVTSWQTQSGEVVVPAGTYHLVFMWGNDGSGGTDPAGAIDNIYLLPNTCPKVRNLNAVSTNSASIDVTWTDTVQGLGWQVEYGPAGFGHGSADAVLDFTTVPSYTASGLLSLATYDIYVRHICSTTDTGMWNKVSTSTAMCDNASYAYNYDSTMSTTTTSYGPAHAYYNYSFSQVIIDSAYLATLGGDISAFAFMPTATTSNTYYTNCEVYLMPTTMSTITSGVSMDSTATLVYQGDLNFDAANDWRLVGFNAPYTWDGSSNLLLTVVRNHGDYSSSPSFAAVSGSSSKMFYGYSDSYTVTPSSIASWSGTSSSSNTYPIYQLISCGAAGCVAPANVHTTNLSYNEATIAWTGAGTNYEVAIRTAGENDYSVETPVSGNTYTFTNLMPSTTYTARVRQNCGEDLGYSNWTMVTFTTDSLPCFAPENVEIVDVTNATVTVNWTANDNQSSWIVRVYSTTFDSSYAVNSHPATVGGFSAGTYNVTVSGMCGGVLQSDWSDTIQFTTVNCDPVSNVTATVNGNSATIAWTNGANNAGAWQLIYGEEGEVSTDDTPVNVTTNPYTISNLANGDYEVYVQAVCGTGWFSGWSENAHATFSIEGQGIADINSNLHVDIYPNPTSNATTISLSGVNGEVTIAVVDMNGRTVQTDRMECSGDCTKKLEVSGLAQGAYFVRIYGENVNTVKKLIVK